MCRNAVPADNYGQGRPEREQMRRRMERREESVHVGRVLADVLEDDDVVAGVNEVGGYARPVDVAKYMLLYDLVDTIAQDHRDGLRVCHAVAFS